MWLLKGVGIQGGFVFSSGYFIKTEVQSKKIAAESPVRHRRKRQHQFECLSECAGGGFDCLFVRQGVVRGGFRKFKCSRGSSVQKFR